MRLRGIYTMDFRKNELTGYAEAMKEQPGLARLGPDDVVLLLSQSRNQLVFIHGFEEIADERAAGGSRKVLVSQRLRLDGSTWNPLMLANYAEQVGLTLDLKKFEHYYRELIAEREAERGKAAA